MNRLALGCVPAVFMLLVVSARGADDVKSSKRHRVIQLNTSPSGANVSGNVQNFPLAVSITGNDFDFGQFKPDGADIRFTFDPETEILSHAIEHWDPLEKTALVWVKLPVVKGNSASQTIHMHWGNPGAADAGPTASVFDTREGFVGVWHLNEAGNTDADGYRDATSNAAHATGVNVPADARVDARVGNGVRLRYPTTQWIKIDNDKRKLFDITDKLTFSIWCKADAYSNKGDEKNRALPGYETMFAKGDNSWRLQKFGIRSWHKPPADLIEMCVEKAPKGGLYVNGVLDKEDTFDMPWSSGDHPVGIGNQSQFPQKGRQWDGILDEARVIGAVKDEHWIKLDYESQREGQKLVTFGPVK